MVKKIKSLWLSYQIYSARKNAEVEEYAAIAASHNARYFHLKAIDLQSKLE